MLSAASSQTAAKSRSSCFMDRSSAAFASFRYLAASSRSTHDGLNDLDHVGASDGPEIALRPFWKNMDSQVTAVFLGRTGSLVAPGVFFQISARQGFKGAGRGGLTFG